MHWILQTNPRDTSQLNKIVQCLKGMGIPYSIHKMIPSINGIIPHVKSNDPKIICFGSSYAIRDVALHQGWTPGIYDIEHADFFVQRDHWGDLMLNADSKVVEFKDASFDGRMFMRPLKEGKAFNGGVFDGHDIAPSLTSPSTLVQISSIKDILSEYRTWIVNSKVVAASQYRKDGELFVSSVISDQVKLFAEMVISIWQPSKAFVLDICETPHGMKIVEINTINGANLYAADVQSIVTSIEDMESTSPM